MAGILGVGPVDRTLSYLPTFSAFWEEGFPFIRDDASTKLLQTLEVYSSRLFFFWDIYLPHLKTSFSRKKVSFFPKISKQKSIQGWQIDPFHSAVELGDLFFCLSAGRWWFQSSFGNFRPNKWRHGKFLHPERIPKSDVVLGKCIYLLSNYGCHFEYPWGEKPENPSIFRKKHSLHTLFFACPTFQRDAVNVAAWQERLQGNGELLKLRDAFQKLQEVHNDIHSAAGVGVYINHFFWTHYERL